MTAIESATAHRSAVMADYDITSKMTGWTLDKLHTKTIAAAALPSDRAMRVFWIDTFIDQGLLEITALALTDLAMIAAEDAEAEDHDAALN